MKSLLLALVIALPSASAFAVSGTAQALQIIETSLGIVKQSDLDFGTAAQGDAAKTVAPGTSEDAENASFKISGQANKAYSITLPADDVVVMETNGGGVPERQIPVNDFASYPAAGANGLLDASGEQTLYVGAARNAILATQESGSYADTFTVTVVY